jgi:hypothetical protein
MDGDMRKMKMRKERMGWDGKWDQFSEKKCGGQKTSV